MRILVLTGLLLVGLAAGSGVSAADKTIAVRDNNGVIVGGNATLNVPPEVYREVLREVLAEQMSAGTQAELQRISEQLGITQKALTAFFKTLGREQVGPADIGAQLQQLAKRHKDLLAELETIRSGDPKVKYLKEQARAAIVNGENDVADRFLVQAFARQKAIREFLKDAYEREALGEADTLSERAGLAMIDWRYRDAALLYQQAAEIAPASATRERARYWHKAGRAFSDGGDYRAAIVAQETALRLKETHHPDNAVDLAATLNDLAVSYFRLGRYADAEPLYQRDLAISEKAPGADHPNVAASLNNLAALYEAQGRYADAEPLYQRSLAI
jgi:tetratricopeptide (TPR) repeat protein